MNTKFSYFLFLQNKITDNHNRYLRQYWDMDYFELEYRHNYIQFMFPLMEISNFNKKAIILTEDDLLNIYNDKSSLYIIQNNMLKSFEVMLNFYGLMMGKSGQIVKASNFDARRKKWIKINNHNYLRITRILKSLMLFGLNDEANNFFNILIQLKDEYPNLINDISIVYWKEAVNII